MKTTSGGDQIGPTAPFATKGGGQQWDDGNDADDDSCVHLPAELWAHSIEHLLHHYGRQLEDDDDDDDDGSTSTVGIIPSSRNQGNANEFRRKRHRHPQRQSSALRYSDLLQLSVVNRQFLRDVASLLPAIHITAPSQLMHPKVAADRFGSGVREVTVDCLFQVVGLQTAAAKDRPGSLGPVAATSNQSKSTFRNAIIRPSANAYRHVASFLSAFPNLERVYLGGHELVDRSISFADDGYTCREMHSRHWHPFHAPASGEIGGNATIVSNLESFLRGQVALNDVDDESTATTGTSSTVTATATLANIDTSNDPFVSAHQYNQRLQHNGMASDLICSICDAYASGTIPPTTHFPGLLDRSSCPIRALNGGVVLAGPRAEDCEFCTKICRSFPIRDIKRVLLDPSNYEESIFDRIFCMSSRRILQTLIEQAERSSEISSPVADAAFVAHCLINKRYAVMSALVDLNLLPESEDASRSINEQVERAVAGGSGLKPDISRYLFDRLAEGGITLRPDLFATFE